MTDAVELTSAGGIARSLVRLFRGTGKLWEDSRFILAEVPLNPGEVKKILPCGMWLTNEASGILFIVNYTRPSFTVPYKEAALLIKVRTLLGKGVHCCWMVVDDDTALIYGRELLGYPKKMAEISFEEKGDQIRASVSRRGVKILEMQGERGKAQTPAPPIFDQKTFNAGGLGQFFIFNPIWLLRPREVIKESYSAKVSVKLAPSEYDPLSRLISGDAFEGRIAITDIPGSKYNLPVGLAGIRHFTNTFYLRFR